MKILPEDLLPCARAGAQQAEIKINSLQPLFRGQWQEKGLSTQCNALT